MRGTNELHFNENTLIEALQEYLEARMLKDCPKVVSVRGATSSGTFVVTVEEAEKES